MFQGLADLVKSTTAVTAPSSSSPIIFAPPTAKPAAATSTATVESSSPAKDVVVAPSPPSETTAAPATTESNQEKGGRADDGQPTASPPVGNAAVESEQSVREDRERFQAEERDAVAALAALWESGHCPEEIEEPELRKARTEESDKINRTSDASQSLSARLQAPALDPPDSKGSLLVAHSYVAAHLRLWRARRFLRAISAEDSSTIQITPQLVRELRQFRSLAADLAPLLQVIDDRQCPLPILKCLVAVFLAVDAKRFSDAENAYYGLAIGNQSWKVGTCGGTFHERAQTQRVYRSVITHVMNHSVVRPAMHAVKLFISEAQHHHRKLAVAPS